MRPSDLLAGPLQQFDMRSEAEKAQAALTAVREVTREQGQVMSAALSNNRSLWETNKKLRREHEQILSTCRTLEGRARAAEAALAAIPDDIKDRALLQLENDALRKANAYLAEQLTASIIPELDTEQRRAELERVRSQQAEILATGLVPTWEEIAAEDIKRDMRELQPGEPILPKGRTGPV